PYLFFCTLTPTPVFYTLSLHDALPIFDVDDRKVEALREVARVAGRPPLDRVGGEPDLVVRNQVEAPAGRVALELGEVERLGDDPLRGKGCVAVDEHRQRDARIVAALAGRTVGLLGAGTAFDD